MRCTATSRVSFTPSASTASVRFADGGLQGLADESWGIDNVLVRRGATTVFSDNFESGTANAAFSDGTVNADARGSFSRFSGRFSDNASQTLNLSGLTAGQLHTLSFDLLVLDTWDGNNPSAGPDLIDVSVDGTSVLRETLANYPDANSAQTLRASAGIRLQIVPTLNGIDTGRPGEDEGFYLRGTGFAEGASTVTIGGVALVDSAPNLTAVFDITGARNDTVNIVAPRTLDGPIRITTEGGYAQIPGANFGAQPVSVFTAIVANANAGTPANGAAPSATTGQTIVLQGQGFSNSTLVQFQGIDDSGLLGTLTRTGSAGAGGTTLSVVVPALARSGNVSVLGSGTSLALQVVPTLTAAGGSVAAGNTLVLEGTGLTGNDLAIAIDGRAVGTFSVRTVIDGTGTSSDQQLLTLTVPSGVGAGLITVSTAGGSSTLRTGATALIALADLTPAGDVGDTLATALDPSLAANRSIKITAGIDNALDVDLVRLDLNAGDQITLNMANAASLYAFVRVFDAAGSAVFGPSQTNPGSANASQRWVAPSSGSFYVGISGYNNTTYNPNVAGSGTNAGYSGTYTLSIERLAAGAGHLASITNASVSASSGVAAQSALASANVGQTITLSGVGLVAGDRLVFSTLNDSGNLAELVVTSTVDVGAQTISATVPLSATTGQVRLERDSTGVLLQIVPTLSNVTITSGNFVGGNLQLSRQRLRRRRHHRAAGRQERERRFTQLRARCLQPRHGPEHHGAQRRAHRADPCGHRGRHQRALRHWLHRLGGQCGQRHAGQCRAALGQSRPDHHAAGQWAGQRHRRGLPGHRCARQPGRRDRASDQRRCRWHLSAGARAHQRRNRRGARGRRGRLVRAADPAHHRRRAGRVGGRATAPARRC